MKRVFLRSFLIAICISILFFALGPGLRTFIWGETPMEAYRALKFVYSEDGVFQHYLYNECKYHDDEFRAFDVLEDRGTLADNYELISWTGSAKALSYIGLDIINKYYALKTEEAPPFLYLQRVEKVLFSENYDLWSATFFVEGTNCDFVLSDALIKSNVTRDVNIFSSIAHIQIFSSKYPSLYLDALIYKVQDSWYLGGNGCFHAYEISDSFLELLCDNGLIEAG